MSALAVFVAGYFTFKGAGFVITGNGPARRRRWQRDQLRSRLHKQGAPVMADPIVRYSFIAKMIEDHLEAVRTAITHGKDVLENNPPVDTFFGRKTQEPFPAAKQ